MTAAERRESDGSGEQVPPPSDDDLLTVAEVAALARTSKWSVYRAINDGRIKTIQLGGTRIPRAAYREFINEAASAARTAEAAETETR